MRQQAFNSILPLLMICEYLSWPEEIVIGLLSYYYNKKL